MEAQNAVGSAEEVSVEVVEMFYVDFNIEIKQSLSFLMNLCQEALYDLIGFDVVIFVKGYIWISVLKIFADIPT